MTRHLKNDENENENGHSLVWFNIADIFRENNMVTDLTDYQAKKTHNFLVREKRDILVFFHHYRKNDSWLVLNHARKMEKVNNTKRKVFVCL